MTGFEQISIGVVLVAMGLLIVRREVGAAMTPKAALALDAVVPLSAYIGLVSATGKPIVCGAGLLALQFAIARADRMEREILREPILLIDVYQTVDVLIRHSQIDILSAGKWRRLSLFGLGAVAVVAALWAERPLGHWSPWPLLAFCLLLWVGLRAVAGRLLQPVAAALPRLGATGDPVADAAKLGFFAMQIVHAVVARAERPARRASVRSVGAPFVHRASSAHANPVVVVQNEAFFDARRLSESVPRDLLPAFDRTCARGVQWGRLTVPGFGGNTMRTEFAVLTGLDEEAIGFDRFNPYQAFARSPVASLASRLRGEGYRTICIHPFDRRFYRRDIVMRNLGFDMFLGAEAFSAPADPGTYVADTDVARLMLDLLREEGPRVFMFAITMQNHGPWPAGTERFQNAMTDRVPLLAGDRALRSFLAGLYDSDRMLAMLSRELRARDDDGVLAFYGDHLPGFWSTFERLGYTDRRSDYVITRARAEGGVRVDLAAHDLSDGILAALQAEPAARARRAY